MAALFSTTLFLSAALLFWVQPMIAKMLLPFLGGVASAVRRALADSARYASAGPRELGYNEYQSRLFPAVEAELSAKGQKVPHPFGAGVGTGRESRAPALISPFRVRSPTLCEFFGSSARKARAFRAIRPQASNIFGRCCARPQACRSERRTPDRRAR